MGTANLGAFLEGEKSEANPKCTETKLPALIGRVTKEPMKTVSPHLALTPCAHSIQSASAPVECQTQVMLVPGSSGERPPFIPRNCYFSTCSTRAPPELQLADDWSKSTQIQYMIPLIHKTIYRTLQLSW